MNEEDLNTEYKQEYVDSIKKTIVAFANTSGGELFIGIDDDGRAIGVKNADEIMLQATSAIREAIKPDITLFTTCEKVRIDGKTIVALKVQKGTECPYYLAKKGLRPAGVYVRQGSSSVPATETAILKMIRETAGDNYEEIRSLNQELTFTALKNEFKLAKMRIEKTQMKTLHVIGKDNLYTNLGLLLSDDCVHTIKLAVFEGTTKEIFKDRYEFGGSLFTQLRECYAFINRCNKTRSEFEDLTRIDTRDYPPTALREALLNSIIHKEYSFSGSTLISIFDDRIEMVTIGGLVKGISKDDILLGVSMLRNKNLADIFYRLKLVEVYGTGIPKIMESYQQYAIQPKIEITDNAFKITLFSTLSAQEEGTKPPPKHPKKDVIYTYGEEKVLDMFISDSATIDRQDIENTLDISQSMAVKHLSHLLDKSAIEKLGDGKNTRYRLK